MSLVSTSKDILIKRTKALHGNPYDGHTLKEELALAEQLTDWRPRIPGVIEATGKNPRADYGGMDEIFITADAAANQSTEPAEQNCDAADGHVPGKR